MNVTIICFFCKGTSILNNNQTVLLHKPCEDGVFIPK